MGLVLMHRLRSSGTYLLLRLSLSQRTLLVRQGSFASMKLSTMNLRITASLRNTKSGTLAAELTVFQRSMEGNKG